MWDEKPYDRGIRSLNFKNEMKGEIPKENERE